MCPTKVSNKGHLTLQKSYVIPKDIFFHLASIQICTRVKGQMSHLHSWLKQKPKSPPSNFNPKTLNQITLSPCTGKQEVPESDTSEHADAETWSSGNTRLSEVLAAAAGMDREHFPLDTVRLTLSTSTNLPNTAISANPQNYTFVYNPPKAMHGWLLEN